jgi:Fe-S-cluster-containing dehydrogenase component
MHKDEKTGIVSVDQSICIGCGYCVWTCPYEAPVMDTEHNVMSKCNFCQERAEKGEQPYCVQACPAHARFFGVLSDPTSKITALIQEKHGERFLPEYDTNPSVFYL